MSCLVAMNNGVSGPGVDPVALMLGSSGVVLVVLLILVVFSTAVWVIWLLKAMQLGRLRRAQRAFEAEARQVFSANDLVGLARRHSKSAGGRVVMELAHRAHSEIKVDLLIAVARRAITTEQQRASVLMPTLSSIASASPFIGLFGTVWGIMNAFLKIGIEKSASLPVVAPAIGEALIATAFGLVAAIPATIGFNYVDKRIGDFLEELQASSEQWAHLLVGDALEPSAAVPLVRASQVPGGE